MSSYRGRALGACCVGTPVLTVRSVRRILQLNAEAVVDVVREEVKKMELSFVDVYLCELLSADIAGQGGQREKKRGEEKEEESKS